MVKRIYYFRRGSNFGSQSLWLQRLQSPISGSSGLLRNLSKQTHTDTQFKRKSRKCMALMYISYITTKVMQIYIYIISIWYKLLSCMLSDLKCGITPSFHPVNLYINPFHLSFSGFTRVLSHPLNPTSYHLVAFNLSQQSKLARMWRAIQQTRKHTV